MTWMSHNNRRYLLCFSLLQLLFFVQINAESKLLGCFKDNPTVNERDLNGMVALEETLITPSFCESLCGERHGFKYFGLQYGSECWCGDSYGRHGAASNDACSKPCSGDSTLMCGGENTNSVYEIMNPSPKPQLRTDERPLLGLVMIVKDEAHTLPQTLLAIKPWIDVYYILDTGSTDGTQDAIRRTLGPNGEIWQEPFIDYGRSRNRALEIAQETKNLGGPPVFSLMLSADETVHNGAALRKFCEEHRDQSGHTEEAYYVMMDVGWRFDSARLSRTDRGWRYVGRVHEYLAAPGGHGSPTHRVPAAYIRFRATDETRRSEREFTILKILQEETRDKPYDTRSSFYLARTYNVVKNHTAALAEFRRRVSLGGWKEEVYESLYAIAWQLEALHAPWHEIQQAFLDAHAHSSERAEPLYAIASHWLREKNYPLAWLFSSHASTLPYPTHASLWVQADVYSWQCNFVMGMSALDINPRRERDGAFALARALKKFPQDQPMLAQWDRYRQIMGDDVVDQIRRQVIDPTSANNANTGQGVIGGHELLVPGVPSLPTRHPPPVTAPWLSYLLGFLVITNIVLLLALRKKSRSGISSCLSGMTDKEGPKEV